MSGVAVPAPLLSANEPEAVVVSLAVDEGQAVSEGDVLCVLENTKTTEEVVAERSGFVVGVRVKQGDRVDAGDVLCWLAAAADWSPPAAAAGGPETVDGLPDGVRITQPALALARELGVDLGSLPVGPLVTADEVRRLAGVSGGAPAALGDGPDPGAIVVFGGGPHGRTLIDLLRAVPPWRVSGVIDDALEPGAIVHGVPVLGGSDAIPRVVADGVSSAANGVAGLTDVDQRIAVFAEMGAAGLAVPALVHPSAVVEPSARVEPGAQVLARAYVGTDAVVGFGSIVNTAAVVSHDCVVHTCANLSPGTVLAGMVVVGEGALLGLNVSVTIGVRIGARAQIGNGAVVNADVPDGAVVRAGTVWSG